MSKRFAVFASMAAWMAVGPVNPVMGLPSITLGTIPLQPNMPGQVVEIHVTGGDPVQGMNFVLSVANGGPENPLGPGPRGPRITDVDILTGTIFAGNNTGSRGEDDDLPQVAFRITTTNSGTVAAEGLLARVTLDTTGLSQGTFTFSLGTAGQFTDFAGVEAALTDGVLVIGSAETGGNQLPTANAGPDQQVEPGATVHLDGSGSDPESAALTYRWRQVNGPAVVLSDWTDPSASFAAPNDVVNTNLVFELTVSDGANERTDSVTIAVGPDASLFDVNAGPDQSVAPGNLVQLAGTITAEHPRAWSTEWVQVGGPTVSLAGSSTANPSFSAPLGLTNTQLTFEFRVFDGTYEAVDTVTVAVDVNSSKPVAHAGNDQTVAAGATVQLEGSGTDPTGQGLAWFWVQIGGPTVRLSSTTVANPTFTAPSLSNPAKLEFELQASSGSLRSSDTVVINVAAAAPPTVNLDTPTGGTSGEETNYEVPAQTQQSVNSLTDWTTSTTIAVGIGLLFLAFLLFWIFVL